MVIVALHETARLYDVMKHVTWCDWATGKLNLATLVTYIPLPVIGGYLAFVGYFCLRSGVMLATGTTAWSPSAPLLLLQIRHARACLHVLLHIPWPATAGLLAAMQMSGLLLHCIAS